MAAPLSSSVSSSHPATQGEIAYVLDGDIWLLDLVSGESQQLTSDGDNRWPTWSDDGEWTTFTSADEVAHSSVFSILQSADGAFWFGTYGGVRRYQPMEK